MTIPSCWPRSIEEDITAKYRSHVWGGLTWQAWSKQCRVIGGGLASIRAGGIAGGGGGGGGGGTNQPGRTAASQNATSDRSAPRNRAADDLTWPEHFDDEIIAICPLA